MWKENNKKIVTFSVKNYCDEEQFKNFLNEKIIEKKYKFFFLNEEKEFCSKLVEMMESLRIEYGFLDSFSDLEDLYESVDFSIHIGGELNIPKSNANWKIIVTNKEDFNSYNVKNCYFVYDLNDVKDILTFFASNELEC